jgi:hypothetical protein
MSTPATRSMNASALSGSCGLGSGTWNCPSAARVFQVRAPIPIGQQAVAADPHEALGQDMQQKAADKLLGSQGKDLHFAVGVVAVTETHPGGGLIDQPLVADGSLAYPPSSSAYR